MDVGVRELKQHLSEYLDRAAEGEIIRITERGRPKAVLGPIPGRHRLDEGLRRGWICAGTGEPVRPAKRFRARTRLADVLDEDRSD